MRAHTLTPPAANAAANEKLLLAQTALDARRFENALQLAAAVLAEAPRCAAAYAVTAQANLMLERYPAAAAAYRKAIDLGCDNAGCWFGLGAAQSVQGYLTKALKSYTKALNSSGCTDEARQSIYYQLALLHLQLGNPDAALGCLVKTDEIAAPDPNLTENLFRRLTIYTQRGRLDEALQCAQQLTALHPDEWDFARVKAQLLLQMGTSRSLTACGEVLDEAAAYAAAPAQRFEQLFDRAVLQRAWADLDPDNAAAHRAEAASLLQQAARLQGIDTGMAAEAQLTAAELQIEEGRTDDALVCACAAAADEALPIEQRQHAAYLASELLFAADRAEQSVEYLPLLQNAENALYSLHGYYLAALLGRRTAPEAAGTRRAYQLAVARCKKSLAEKDTTAVFYLVKLESDFGCYDNARRLLRTLPAADAAALEQYIADREKEAAA